MAVVVQCFHCNAILELDDGFRGGVCRCGNCGALLQVPKGDASEAPVRAARPAGPPGPARQPAAPQKSTGVAEPGVASSGRLDPTRGQDLGGISSGLGRIHKTKPLSHKPLNVGAKEPVKGVLRPEEPAASDAAAVEGKQEGTPAPQSHDAPRTPAWLGSLLIVLTGAVAMIYVYFFKH